MTVNLFITLSQDDSEPSFCNVSSNFISQNGKVLAGNTSGPETKDAYLKVNKTNWSHIQFRTHIWEETLKLWIFQIVSNPTYLE